MENLNFKKIITIIYSFAFFYYLLGYTQFVYSKLGFTELKNVRIVNYGEIVKPHIITRINELLDEGFIYLTIALIILIALLCIRNIFFKFRKNKNIKLIILAVEAFLSAGLITIIILILILLPNFMDLNLISFTAKTYNNYEYSLLSESQSLLMIPFFSLIIISIITIYNVIDNLIGSKESLDNK